MKFKFKRKKVIVIAVLLITVLAFIFSFGALMDTSSSNISTGLIKVVLDAGHGGIDGGVTGVNTGVKESELNLAVVRKLENYLVSAGIEVVLTRTSDAGLYGVFSGNLKKKDMSKRKEIILKACPTLVISVHMNKYSISSRRGAQVFFKESDDNAYKLATSIQESFNGMEEAPRVSSPLKGDYYILNCSNVPSVICECGFLSNPTDESLLITEEYQDKVSYAIFKGVVNYLSISSMRYF